MHGEYYINRVAKSRNVNSRYVYAIYLDYEHLDNGMSCEAQKCLPTASFLSRNVRDISWTDCDPLISAFDWKVSSFGYHHHRLSWPHLSSSCKTDATDSVSVAVHLYRYGGLGHRGVRIVAWGRFYSSVLSPENSNESLQSNSLLIFYSQDVRIRREKNLRIEQQRMSRIRRTRTNSTRSCYCQFCHSNFNRFSPTRQQPLNLSPTPRTDVTTNWIMMTSRRINVTNWLWCHSVCLDHCDEGRSEVAGDLVSTKVTLKTNLFRGFSIISCNFGGTPFLTSCVSYMTSTLTKSRFVSVKFSTWATRNVLHCRKNSYGCDLPWGLGLILIKCWLNVQ